MFKAILSFDSYPSQVFKSTDFNSMLKQVSLGIMKIKNIYDPDQNEMVKIIIDVDGVKLTEDNFPLLNRTRELQG